MRTAKTLIRLGGCPCWPESSLGAQVILLILSCGGSFIFLSINFHALHMVYNFMKLNFHKSISFVGFIISKLFASWKVQKLINWYLIRLEYGIKRLWFLDQTEIFRGTQTRKCKPVVVMVLLQILEKYLVEFLDHKIQIKFWTVYQTEFVMSLVSHED